MIRKIYEPTYEGGHWRIKKNKEIYNRFKSPDVVTVIIVGILEWFGLVVRMDGTLQGL
jgi:hypothetical protein